MKKWALADERDGDTIAGHSDEEIRIRYYNLLALAPHNKKHCTQNSLLKRQPYQPER